MWSLPLESVVGLHTQQGQHVGRGIGGGGAEGGHGQPPKHGQLFGHGQQLPGTSTLSPPPFVTIGFFEDWPFPPIKEAERMNKTCSRLFNV